MNDNNKELNLDQLDSVNGGMIIPGPLAQVGAGGMIDRIREVASTGLCPDCGIKLIDPLNAISVAGAELDLDKMLGDAKDKVELVVRNHYEMAHHLFE
jgi:hypothetical protein